MLLSKPESAFSLTHNDKNPTTLMMMRAKIKILLNF
jgi:hypothetical protein